MTTLFQRYATPFITGLFLVSLISGIALFFHVGQAAFHGMHEWLSMVLILPFVLHLWKNWRPMVAYLSKPAFALASVVSIVAALAFAWPALTGTATIAGGPPPMVFATRLLEAAPQALAPALGTTPDQLIRKLADAGFTAAKSDMPLKEIASASGKSSFAIMEALTK